MIQLATQAATHTLVAPAPTTQHTSELSSRNAARCFNTSFISANLASASARACAAAAAAASASNRLRSASSAAFLRSNSSAAIRSASSRSRSAASFSARRLALRASRCSLVSLARAGRFLRPLRSRRSRRFSVRRLGQPLRPPPSRHHFHTPPNRRHTRFRAHKQTYHASFAPCAGSVDSVDFLDPGDCSCCPKWPGNPRQVGSSLCCVVGHDDVCASLKSHHHPGQPTPCGSQRVEALRRAMQHTAT